MELRVNGETREVAAQSVAALLDELGYEGGFYAVALNQELVRRGDWGGASLAEGDEVEILTPRQGG